MWVEDTLKYLKAREDWEKSNPLLLTLFRYLQIEHRLANPYGKEVLIVSEDLRERLRRAICDKAAEYFGRVIETQITKE